MVTRSCTSLRPAAARPLHVSSRRAIPILAIVVAVIGGLFVAPAGAHQTPTTGADSSTTAVSAPPAPPQRSRAEIRADLDVLSASSDEIERALDQIDTQLAAERAAADEANIALLGAQTELERAKAAVADAEAEADRTADEVTRMAVDAYVNPPSEQMIAILVSGSATEARQRQSYLASKTADRARVLDERQAALDALAAKEDAALAARDEMQSAAEARDAAVAQLEASRAVQADLAEQVQSKIEQNESELASLDAADRARAAAAALERQRLAAVAARAAAPPPTAAPATVPPAAPPAVATPATNPPTTRPPTTSPPVTVPPLVGPGDLAVVAGFTVNKSIATAFGNMIEASKAAGIVLGGGAYRSPQAQINTRRNNCGPTDYDIYVKPSSACSPPTARPGTSMHEQGLAIDFTCSGSLITSRSGPCWNWLATYAADYGFYNLPSEPWHWSVNGR